MARKRSATSSAESNALPRLRVSRGQAQPQIAARIEAGHRLLESAIQTDDDLNSAEAEFRRWDEYNTTMLRRLFDTAELADEYEPGVGFVFLGSLPLQKEIESHGKDVQRKIDRLESISGRLNLYEEPSLPTVPEVGPSLGTDIFVVHGRDEAAKESVARFIEKLDLAAIILHEKPSAGRTIIEKFEDESSSVGYAVVLLTPDDIGGPADEPEDLKPRARQNVIFELGFLLGRLGRDRVCALHKNDIDIPSDYEGVVYTPMDSGGGWRLKLAKEIKHAGIDVDLNKAL